MVDEKTIYYSLDLEHDYAGVAPVESYITLQNKPMLARFAKLIERFNIKLTVFATGKILEKQRETVEFFRQLGAEIELHGYDHVMYNPDFDQEVKKGIRAYRDYFGAGPLGYRSPGGAVSHHLFDLLAEVGIRYDSSIVPSFRPGAYNNFTASPEPYYHSGTQLLELPIAVVPKVRLLVAASYIRLLGLPTYKLLFRLCGYPKSLVYLFHLVDIIPVPAVRQQLTPFLRMAYKPGERRGMDCFENSLAHFVSAEYRSEHMSKLYQQRREDSFAPTVTKS
jgi:hypothetical protein